MAGRPTKLDKQLVDRLCTAIRGGNYYEAACAYAGIDYSTFRKWMQKGEKSSSGVFFEFFEAIKKAEADCEARVVALWQQQIPNDWKAAATFLERRYPERWGRKDKFSMQHNGEIAHSGAVSVAHVVSGNLMERLNKYTEIYEKLAREEEEDAGDEGTD